MTYAHWQNSSQTHQLLEHPPDLLNYFPTYFHTSSLFPHLPSSPTCLTTSLPPPPPPLPAPPPLLFHPPDRASLLPPATYLCPLYCLLCCWHVHDALSQGAQSGLQPLHQTGCRRHRGHLGCRRLEACQGWNRKGDRSGYLKLVNNRMTSSFHKGAK